MEVVVQRIVSFVDTVEMESLMTLLVSSASKSPPSTLLQFSFALPIRTY